MRGAEEEGGEQGVHREEEEEEEERSQGCRQVFFWTLVTGREVRRHVCVCLMSMCCQKILQNDDGVHQREKKTIKRALHVAQDTFV